MCFSSVYKKALEKNQQWLVYDQQREVYVKEVLARTLELEQQLNQANQALQQQHKEGDSAGKKNRGSEPAVQCGIWHSFAVKSKSTVKNRQIPQCSPHYKGLFHTKQMFHVVKIIIL